jgi:transcriptional regulator
MKWPENQKTYQEKQIMYSRPMFQMTQSECFELIKKRAFGQMTSCYQGQIKQSLLPFLLDSSNNCLLGHIAKQNDHFEHFQQCDDLRVSFLGHDAYISPSWYKSEQQVPTWNYQAVEIAGTLTPLNNDATLEIIDQLSQFHENDFEYPWTLDKVEPKRQQAMLNAIVGFKIEIKTISGISKMSQNKSAEDQQALIRGLDQRNQYASDQVSKIMTDSK